MCIILACKPGHRPTAETLVTCWQHNPDGAGIMWSAGGRVEIEKGLMRLADLQRAVALAPRDAPLVIHMRIGTSGGLGPEVTHPYPVSDSLEALHALDVECSVGIAHNGVLDYPTDTARGVSDTVYYVGHVVAPLASKRATRRAGGLLRSRKALRRLKLTSEGSRLALLDGEGRVELIGTGWQGVAAGIQASNSSWRADCYRRVYGGAYAGAGASLYDWDEDEDEGWGIWSERAEVMSAWGCDFCDCYGDCYTQGPCCIPADFSG